MKTKCLEVSVLEKLLCYKLKYHTWDLKSKKKGYLTAVILCQYPSLMRSFERISASPLPSW